MKRWLAPAVLALSVVGLCNCASAQEMPEAPPATQPGIGHFPHMSVNLKKREVRVDCESLNVDMRLEFFCVLDGTNEHESVLRTAAKPSDIHTALLMLGLKPGEPVRYSEAAKKWLPPHGPPIQIFCEYQKDGKTVSIPAYRMMRNADTHKVPDAFTWIFDGSRVMDDKSYAADATGYVVSVVNFDLTMIDVPELASNANETLQWEYNPDTVPKTGTPVTMILKPAGQGDNGGKNPPAPVDTSKSTGASAALSGPAVVKVTADGKIELNNKPIQIQDLPEAVSKLPADSGPVRLAAPKDINPDLTDSVAAAIEAGNRKWERVSTDGASKAAPATGDADAPISTVHTDAQKMADLKARWEKAVRPNEAALKQAAQAHYEVITAMRKEQQRLIDEADRIQRAIDELEKEYQDMTTPQPPADQPQPDQTGQDK